jgi:plastocyanin
MKTSSKFLAIPVALLLLVIPTGLFAVTHTVNFGGALGFVFSPSSFTASVGDTVKWVGDFTIHTTTSTSVPATAATWDHGATTSTTTSPFIYVIHVAGAYNYHCAIHYTLGMIGSFTASAAAIRTTQTDLPGSTRVTMKTISGAGRTTILLNVPLTTTMSVGVFNCAGQQILSLNNHKFDAGTNRFTLSHVPRGVYLLTMQANGITSTNTFVLRD